MKTGEKCKENGERKKEHQRKKEKAKKKRENRNPDATGKGWPSRALAVGLAGARNIIVVMAGMPGETHHSQLVTDLLSQDMH